MMIKEVKIEKMDKSEMRKIDGGQPPRCDGCNLCGTKGNDNFLLTFVFE
jgi:hypothetical protein